MDVSHPMYRKSEILSSRQADRHSGREAHCGIFYIIFRKHAIPPIAKIQKN